ncbi:Gfo/Idh/MocA family oxidoreductase [Luteococcus peritonei]|uniref:Gfo/Idh/MocA family protein n=1 Tax=Luteococcus peritonei TaxID=88874 RepID=A0ABW4RW92_9ACTN
MVRFATIGTSSIVDRFVDAVAVTDEAVYTVAHSRDLERAQLWAAGHGAQRAVDHLEQLAGATDVDAVYIASPNALHHDQAELLLRAGKHVLVEKSACSTLAEWQHLLDIAHANQVVLLESVRTVHDPSWRMITSYLPSLGPVRQVELHMAQRSRRYDNFLAGRVENIFRPEMSAGALMDLGVYCLHPLVTLFGLPGRIQASSVLLRNGIDGATSLLLDYPGFTASVSCSKTTVDPRPSMLSGEDATLLVDAIADPQRLRMADAHTGEVEDLQVDKPLPQQAYVLQAFARMVQDPTLAAVHQQATTDALTVMDEARRQVGLDFPADSRTLA